MAGFTVAKRVEAPVEIVFDIASDLERLPDIVEAITKIEIVTDGPVGVGTRFRETRVLFKREATEEMEITKFDRPHSYSTIANSCGCRYDTTVTVKALGSGSEISMDFSATPLTFMAKVFSVMMKFMLNSCAKAVEKDLESIKVAAEASAAAEAS